MQQYRCYPIDCGWAQEESLTRQKAEVRRKLRERRVPSSPIGRVFGFAQLGASLVYGTMSDSVSQYFRGGGEGAAGAKANTTGNRRALVRMAVCHHGQWQKLGFWRCATSCLSHCDRKHCRPES